MPEKDSTLVRKTLAGERNAFGDLVERYNSLVHGLIWEITRHSDAVEDLVQEVFCKAYEDLSRLRQPARFPAWLASIAANKAQDWLRRRQVRYRAEQAGNILPLADYTPPQERFLESSEMADALWEALDRLSPEFRRIVVLHHLEGCTLRDIAQFLGMSLATVKWRLARAQKQLKQDLFIAHYQEVGCRSRNKREVRDKIMMALPVVAFFRREAYSEWLGRWGFRLGLSLGLVGMVGLVGTVSYLESAREETDVGGESGLRVRRLDVKLPEMSVLWQPRSPRPGETVRIEAAGVEGERVELHYRTDPWSARDRVAVMEQQGDAWTAEIEMPDEAKAVFFYVSAGGEDAGGQSGLGPSYMRGVSPTDRKILRRYRHSFLVYGADGKPVQSAEFYRATMAKYQGEPLEESLAHLNRELALYPDNFSIYSERWRYMLEENGTSADLQREIKAEHVALITRFPDRPEPLRVASSFWPVFGRDGEINDGNLAYLEEIYQQLYRRFPDSEEAQVSGYLMANKFFFARNYQKLASISREFVSRFPQSRFLDSMYWYLLIGLGQVDAEQAGVLADSLMAGTAALRADPGRERGADSPPMNIGGFLPEGLAYSLRFDLLAAAGDSAGALDLARRLIASETRDPLPYLHIGERLARLEAWSLTGLREGFEEQAGISYPRNVPLSVELLETGLPLTGPDDMFRLPGFHLPEDGDTPGADETRAWYLERIAGWRGRFLVPLGRCYFTLGKHRRAAACLEEAVALREKKSGHDLARLNDAVYLLLGEVYERMEDWRSAEAAYLRIVEQFHSHPQAEDGLERVHWKLHGHLRELPPLLAACHPQAPDFRVTEADGHVVRLSDLQGRVVLVFYTLMRSAEGDEIAALLEDWAGQFAPRDLEILFVTARNMKDLDDRERSFRVASDEDGMREQYGIGPGSLILIDRQGRLRLRREQVGRQSQPEQELQIVDKLRELIAEEGPADWHLTSEEMRR